MAFGRYGHWVAFALECISEAMALINELGGRGAEVVSSKREGKYRYWDPETLRVDKVVEDLFVCKLREKGVRAIVLSEEAKRLEIRGEGGPEEIYFVSDPFDGSLLYKRGIPAFWYTCLAIYGTDGRAKCAAIGDCIEQAVDFANEEGAFTGKLKDGHLINVSEMKPSQTTELGQAFVETYLMKPHFMYPTVLTFKPLFKKVKFILPNGGPGGFADVAKGRVDVYLAIRQPFVDVFPGLAIAKRAGAVVTTFGGEEIVFEDDIDNRYDIVCSANPILHKQILAEIWKITG